MKNQYARFLFPALLLLSLSACDTLQQYGIVKPQYKPLDSEIAALAAPQTTPAPGTHPLFCSVGLGAARFGKNWYDFETTGFTLPEKARVNISLSPKTGAGASGFQGFFDEDGQKLVFCPLVDGPPGKTIACTSLYALDDDLQAGIRRTFDIPEAIRGASITCAYETGKLQKL